MCECKRMNCGYWYKMDYEPFASCHFPDDSSFPAPCEIEDEDYEDDLEIGFNPYEGCYDYDC